MYDCIPVKFIKSCKIFLSPIIKIVVYYIIDHREFPDGQTRGLNSAVFKLNIAHNFRGITIIPIMGGIHELAVYRRFAFWMSLRLLRQV